MTRLYQDLQTRQALGSLAALSSPRDYLEFVLSRTLTQEEGSEVLFSFIRKFGQFVPRPIPVAVSREGLISLLARAANNYEKGE